MKINISLALIRHYETAVNTRLVKQKEVRQIDNFHTVDIKQMMKVDGIIQARKSAIRKMKKNHSSASYGCGKRFIIL